MKKEFAMLFKKRYIYLIIMSVLMLTFMLIGQLTFIDSVKSSEDSVYGEYISDLPSYSTIEELKEIYDCEVGDAENPTDYISLIYKFALDNNLPYDSLVEFDLIPKYTPFHYFTNFSIYYGYFILLAAIVVGAFYQTGEVMSKMSKMVYSGGTKRTKLIDIKYLVSLMSLTAFTLIGDIIMAISASIEFANSDAIYCVIYTGRSLISLNFFEFFLLNVFSHLLIATFIYTITYYLAVIIKNGVIMLCISFVFIIMTMLVEFPSWLEKINDILRLGGYIAVLYAPSSAVEFKDVALIIPFGALAVSTFIISRPMIKRMDYSR